MEPNFKTEQILKNNVITAFARNAKSFAIACVVVAFFSPSRQCFSNGLAKVPFKSIS